MRLFFVLILAALLTACGALLQHPGMSADAIVSSWVGRDLDELHARWKGVNKTSWNDSRRQTMHYVVFGTNDQEVRRCHHQARNICWEDFVPGQTHCSVGFYTAQDKTLILGYEMKGRRCDEYVRSWGPAPPLPAAAARSKAS